jgi:hypothetical protein
VSTTRLGGTPDASADTPEGVSFRPAEGGQFSRGADTRGFCRFGDPLESPVIALHFRHSCLKLRRWPWIAVGSRRFGLAWAGSRSDGRPRRAVLPGGCSRYSRRSSSSPGAARDADFAQPWTPTPSRWLRTSRAASSSRRSSGTTRTASCRSSDKIAPEHRSASRCLSQPAARAFPYATSATAPRASPASPSSHPRGKPPSWAAAGRDTRRSSGRNQRSAARPGSDATLRASSPTDDAQRIPLGNLFRWNPPMARPDLVTRLTSTADGVNVTGRIVSRAAGPQPRDGARPVVVGTHTAGRPGVRIAADR